jgi:hypothetical protein
LQRYCDPNTPFSPLPQFNGAFKRDVNTFNWDTSELSSLFTLALSSDPLAPRGVTAWGAAAADVNVAALRKLDEVSTNEIEKITRLLSERQHTAGTRPHQST